MPWQQHVSDVALEVNPETGRLHYRTVVITVPRQSGKTTLLLSLMVHRAMNFGERQNILYTAQTQLAARKKFEDEHVYMLRKSPLLKYFKVRLSMGSEQIKWNNGSRHGITPPTEKAGHGETLDMATLDEAFAQIDARVEQALRPAMITRPQPQFYVISTAGSSKSLYLKDKVERGRNSIDHWNPATRVAYFEWSAPDDSDPSSHDVWRACMPALGYTIDIEAVQDEFDSMDLSEFRRAYLNQWADEIPDQWLVISETDWNTCKDQESFIPEENPLVFAMDHTPERSFGTIVAAGLNKDSQIHFEIPRNSTEVLDHRPGTAWMVPRMKQLHDKWKPSAVIIQANSPAASMIPDLKRAGIEVQSPSGVEYAAACGMIYDKIYQADIRHMGQAALARAMAAAVKYELPEGNWKWSRKQVFTDISPLVAATLAAWGLMKFGTDDSVAPWASWI